jgi:hypothetical protein
MQRGCPVQVLHACMLRFPLSVPLLLLLLFANFDGFGVI